MSESNATLSKNRVCTVRVQYDGFHIFGESSSRPSVKPFLPLLLSSTEARNFTLECCGVYRNTLLTLVRRAALSPGLSPLLVKKTGPEDRVFFT